MNRTGITRLTRCLAFAGALTAGGCVSGSGESVPGAVPSPSERHAPPFESRATPRSRPFPRALDPIPPLYVPPTRDLPLQPILVAPRTEARKVLRPRPPYHDPLGPDNPLRRIDPVTGRDPLGRFDPSGGVDFGNMRR